MVLCISENTHQQTGGVCLSPIRCEWSHKSCLPHHCALAARSTTPDAEWVFCNWGLPWTQLNPVPAVLIKIFTQRSHLYNTGIFLTTFIHFNSNQGLEPFVQFCCFEAKHFPFSTSSIFHLVCNFNFIIIILSIFYLFSKEEQQNCLHTSVAPRNNCNRLEAFIPSSHLGEQKLLSIPQDSITILAVIFHLLSYSN